MIRRGVSKASHLYQPRRILTNARSTSTLGVATLMSRTSPKDSRPSHSLRLKRTRPRHLRSTARSSSSCSVLPERPDHGTVLIYHIHRALERCELYFYHKLHAYSTMERCSAADHVTSQPPARQTRPSPCGCNLIICKVLCSPHSSLQLIVPLN